MTLPSEEVLALLLRHLWYDEHHLTIQRDSNHQPGSFPAVPLDTSEELRRSTFPGSVWLQCQYSNIELDQLLSLLGTQ